MAIREELRPDPGIGTKPSGRPWNEIEQTPGGLHYSQPGTPEFRKQYRFASQVFDAEAHHIIDLGYIDKMLHKAGFTTGAHGTKNFSEARELIINTLRDEGIDVGNVEPNLVPLSQHKSFTSGKKRTGLAHKFVHDAYNRIPEAKNSFLRTLNAQEFSNYLVEKTRQRKALAGAAMSHKYQSMIDAHPELQNLSVKKQRDWIHANSKEFGRLGDDTLADVLEKQSKQFIPEVPGQPRGRVPVDPIANNLFRNRNVGFMGAAAPAVLNASGFIPTTKTAQHLKDEEYGQAAISYLTDSSTSAAAGALVKKLSTPAMQLMMTTGILKKLGGRAIAATAGGPIGVAAVSAMTAKDIYDVTNVLTNGALEARQIRGRSGAAREKDNQSEIVNQFIDAYTARSPLK
tara:strand:- start:353 stop:1555 length:1203 start_codon:yes stop_codon:yes gene_type:complete